MAWDDETARLVGHIYDSVDIEKGWMPMLESVGQSFDALGVHLFVRDLAAGEFLEDSYSGPFDEALQPEFERLLPTDPAWPIAAQNPGAVINDVDHYSARMFERTPVYNEVLRKIECYYRTATNLPIVEGQMCGFALTRSKPTGAFENQDIERLERLLPHIVRALRLQRRLRQVESEADHLVAALDGLPTAALIVKETCEIICHNRQADELLDGSKCLRVRRGELVPHKSDEASALDNAVSDAIALADGVIETAFPPPKVVSITRGASLPLEVLAVPLRPRYQLRQSLDQKARALLLIYDPASRPRINPALIERLFGLTPTEADVAARLAEGMSTAEIADARRCSTSTVRTHIKRILNKTRTNRQAELVQLILTSPAISLAG